MEEVVELLTHVALKATYGNAPYKYLGVEDDGKLAYSIDKVVNQRAKFAIEYYGSTGFAHIRSCYNNKYWVRSSESEYWIVATANDPVNDKSAWNCTLFKANLSEDGKTVRFDHVQLGKTLGRRDDELYLCLDPLATTPTTSAVFDYAPLVILPRFVTFKNPKNDFYLSIISNPDLGYAWPIFQSHANIWSPDATIYEVFTTRDGHIYLRTICDQFDVNKKYWGILSCRPNEAAYFTENLITFKEFKWDDEPTDTDMLFSVVNVNDQVKNKKNIVSLRHLRTNNFLEKRGGGYYINHIGSALTATSNYTKEGTELEVVEPIRRRDIHVTEFHLDRARVYDRIPLTLAEGGASNSSETSEQEFTLELTYIKTKTSSWNRTNSWNVNFNITLSSKIPVIGDGSISIGGGYSSDYQWGESVDKSEEVKSSYKVKVPPMKKVIVKVVATEGKCDVPYSYKQTDHKMNGEVKTTKFTDGLYTGVNSYHFDYDVQYKPLNATS